MDLDQITSALRDLGVSSRAMTIRIARLRMTRTRSGAVGSPAALVADRRTRAKSGRNDLPKCKKSV